MTAFEKWARTVPGLHRGQLGMFELARTAWQACAAEAERILNAEWNSHADDSRWGAPKQAALSTALKAIAKLAEVDRG